MKIDTLNTLLQEEMKDIYDFEKRLVRAIPKMAKAASSEQLSSALLEHLEVTRGHVSRVERVFELLDVPAKAKPCAGMKGIIEEGEETIEQDGEETLLDVAITGAAQRVEHYEMAAYASARAMAEHLRLNEVVDLLQRTWDEEREADQKLASLAEELMGGIQAGGGEEEEEPVRKPAGKKTAQASRQS
jgi:ferritin-like metal-binding protein YciE